MLEGLGNGLRALWRYPSAVVGLIILVLLFGGSLYAVIALPYQEIGANWFTPGPDETRYVPRLALPEWVNWLNGHDLPETLVLNSREVEQGSVSKVVERTPGEVTEVTITFTFDFPYEGFPQDMYLTFDAPYERKMPFALFTWLTPDGRTIQMRNLSPASGLRYGLDKLVTVEAWFSNEESPEIHALFAAPGEGQAVAQEGTYTLQVQGLLFEADTNFDVELVVMGQVYGLAGTDFMRRDLLIPLLWGMPFALGFGLFGAVLTTVLAMVLAAAGVWHGGWVDSLIQRLTEANMILPVLAVSVLVYAYFHVSLWVIVAVMVLLSVFGTPTKNFRAAFMQVKEEAYVEAARVYGASNGRIILRYMVPRIVPVLVPQLVMLIPAYIFLEATLAFFNVKAELPTWGRVIYEAMRWGAAYGSRFWVMEPLCLIILTGLAFGMLGFALDRILNPRLRVMAVERSNREPPRER